MSSTNLKNNCKKNIAGKLKDIGSTIALMDEDIFNDPKNFEVFDEMNEALLKMVRISISKKNKDVLERNQYELIKKIGFREFLDKFTREVIQMSLEENNYKSTKAIKELKISTATFYRYLDETVPQISVRKSKVEEVLYELH